MTDVFNKSGAAMVRSLTEQANYMEQAEQREIEVVTADMETKLRGTLLRIIRPALDQTADQAAHLETLERHLERHDCSLNMAEHLKEEFVKQDALVRILQENLERLDTHMHRLEKDKSADIIELRNSISELDKRFSVHEGDLRNQDRQWQRIWEETSRLQEQHDETKKKVWDGISACNKKNERVRDECLEQIRDLQRQREELLEDLYGEDKGLNRLTRDIQILFKDTEPLPRTMRGLEEVKAHAVAIEKEQKIVAGYFEQCQAVVDEFTTRIDKQLNSWKIDFKQDANRLVAHHASLMKDIRRDYIDEIENVKALREEIQVHQQNTDAFCQQVADRLQTESLRVDAMHQEVVNDLEDIIKKRKKDRTAFELAMGDARKAIEADKEAYDDVQQRIEYLSRIVGLVLEGERLANALSVQDYADRTNERWLMLPAETSQKPYLAPATDPQELQQRRANTLDASKFSGVVAIDWRKGLAQSGYVPGQVKFSGMVFDRKDLLLMHHKLLQKAHQALNRAKPMDGEELAKELSVPLPAPVEPAGSYSASMQPGAMGGASAEGEREVTPRTQMRNAARFLMEAQSTAEEDEDVLSPASVRKRLSGKGSFSLTGGSGSGSRQRPGSQGQPQAMGSRGTQFGPLGDTAPSGFGQPTPRLPAISSERESNSLPKIHSAR